MSLLEKWLEGVGNSNTLPGVKKEKKDWKASFQSSCNEYLASKPSSVATSTSLASTPAAVTKPEQKIDVNSVDSKSLQGIFGWEKVVDTVLPVIFRENERLVPVRIVESKIISQYSSILPWTVFSCINIRSYYVTEREASLLNEINSQHCDYTFGYENFSTKDVVVSLKDVLSLQTFLDTSKNLFRSGTDLDWIGFISLPGCTVVPFICKTLDCGKKKLVPQSLVKQQLAHGKVESYEMDEWDRSYLRMLLICGGMEHLNLASDEKLICLDDLKWDYTQLRSSSPGSTLRSLHQVTSVEVAGTTLKAINLKPYSMQQAVFVGDVATYLFPGVPILSLHHILEKILQVKLYDMNSLHEDAFIRSGSRVIQGDKFISVDVLRKCLPQLRQIILVTTSNFGYATHLTK